MEMKIVMMKRSFFKIKLTKTGSSCSSQGFVFMMESTADRGIVKKGRVKTKYGKKKHTRLQNVER